MQEKTIELRGERVRLLEGGSGPTVLYLHGAGGLSPYALFDRLAARHRVLAPEHPGFGRAPGIPDWLTNVGDLAYFYLDFLAALGLGDVHLVGHSLGGWTAAEIAIRSTARLKSLALMAPAGVPANVTPYGDIFLWTPEQHARNSFFDQALAEARIAALPDQDLDVALQNRAAAARLGWAPRLHNPQLPHWLHRIDVPTVLIWGEEDRICPFDLHRTFLDTIGDATLCALPRCGHALHTERADEVADRLAAFLAGR
jgi:pimeloyl-ACP methyl ester carboxylesterase